MFKISIRQGKGGRWRWFAVQERDEEGNYIGRVMYSSFPRSFDYEQSAWEDAEWACGASVELVIESHAWGQTVKYAGEREFSD